MHNAEVKQQMVNPWQYFRNDLLFAMTFRGLALTRWYTTFANIRPVDSVKLGRIPCCAKAKFGNYRVVAA